MTSAPVQLLCIVFPAFYKRVDGERQLNRQWLMTMTVWRQKASIEASKGTSDKSYHGPQKGWGASHPVAYAGFSHREREGRTHDRASERTWNAKERKKKKKRLQNNEPGCSGHPLHNLPVIFIIVLLQRHCKMADCGGGSRHHLTDSSRKRILGPLSTPPLWTQKFVHSRCTPCVH